MIAQLTVTLQDRVQQSASSLAALTGRSMEEILAAMLELSLSPFVPPVDFDQPVTSLSDDDILALTSLQMQPDRDQKLSDLLAKQQADNITEIERVELHTLMRVQEIGMIYRSQALAEAVKRGLREPLKP